jgi:hypothetical protein
MELGRIRLNIKRFGFIENKLDAIAYSISRLIYTILTNLIVLSFKEVLT